MSRRERFEGVVYLIFVAGADPAVVHDLVEAVAGLSGCRDVGFADVVEVGSGGPE